MSNVLIEGRNLAIRQGTGIATYCRGLVEACTTLGHHVDVLFQTEFPPRVVRPSFNEIELFDYEARHIHGRKGRIHKAFELRRVVTDLFGARAAFVPWSGLIADTSPFRSLRPFRNRYAIQDLFRRANLHLLLYGRRLRVSVPERPDLFHATHPTPLMVSGRPNVYTVHDLIPLRLPHTTLDNKSLFLRTLQVIVRSADHVITVSEKTREDMIRFVGIDEKRITNTYQAVALPQELVERPADEASRDLEFLNLDPEQYFLFVGAIEPKKNVERLLEAYLASGTRRRLVLAGPSGWTSAAEIERILQSTTDVYRIEGRALVPEKRILHLSYVPLHLLVSLVKRARALLFPSLYEGFGLPALEAMTLGIPVLSSNTSSLPEVVGEAGLLVNPYDTVQMATAIRELDADDDLRAELSRRGRQRSQAFSVERYRQRLHEVYSSVL